MDGFVILTTKVAPFYGIVKSGAGLVGFTGFTGCLYTSEL